MRFFQGKDRQHLFRFLCPATVPTSWLIQTGPATLFAYNKCSLQVAVAGCDPAGPFLLHTSVKILSLTPHFHSVIGGRSRTDHDEWRFHFTLCLNQVQSGGKTTWQTISALLAAPRCAHHIGKRHTEAMKQKTAHFGGGTGLRASSESASGCPWQTSRPHPPGWS